jgi:hypothetical protein
MARISTVTLFFAGLACMFAAVCMQSVTLASQRYGTTLLTALALALAADVCLVAVARRGNAGWRVASTFTMLPTLFIVADFLRRAPYTF